MKIDAHHHLWDLTVRDQPWTAELPVLRRSFAMADLEPSLAEHGVDGTILVQTITVADETPEFLALADENPRILGVVGWVDLTADTVAEDIEKLRRLRGGEHLVGIRHQVQGEPNARWLLRDDVRRGLQAVADARLVYELLVTHEQLPAAVEAVSTVRGARWVLDHAGKPPIASGELDPWREHITALAAHPDVACKLSGMVTEAGEEWTAEDLRPYADHVLDSFGAERVMFGSDWPVCLLRASYYEVVALTNSLISGLSPDERARVLGQNAVNWYAL